MPNGPGAAPKAAGANAMGLAVALEKRDAAESWESFFEVAMAKAEAPAMPVTAAMGRRSILKGRWDKEREKQINLQGQWKLE